MLRQTFCLLPFGFCLYNPPVQARFVLGPAGSGKTWRCLEEARQELIRDPSGPPLLFLAPKQATFQIERQLLSDPGLSGFTRLQITSLDRLAGEILEDSGSELRLLSEEGRVMVLRALLARHHTALEVFHSTARLTGFARQLGVTLRDCRRYQLGPAALRKRAAKTGRALAGKLRDCAFLLEHYEAWLLDHCLQDPDVLMDAAVAVVRAWPASVPGTNPARLHGLWLDGFAEMTPQELDFLAALVPHCTRSTLAFCLPQTEPDRRPAFDPWTLVAGTYASLLHRLEHQTGLEVSLEYLPGQSQHSRFTHSPVLAHLERHWGAPVPFPRPTAPDRIQAEREAAGSLTQTAAPTPDLSGNMPASDPQPPGLRIVTCPHPEAEAIVAAREILDHVHEGGRFRETAILVRSLEPYHAVLQRVLRRYEIPFFLDRRELVAHHPLAELTRYVLRTLAYRWQHEDWFGALKTGLLPVGAEEVDILENEALARGWEGGRWLQPLVIEDNPRLSRQLEAMRRRVLAPLRALQITLGDDADCPSPTGEVLSRGLLEFWQNLGVAEQLQDWSDAGPRDSRYPAVHSAVWEQMLDWLDNLALAFSNQAMSLLEWLPIVESGLAGLTVGVIPPALDQVLIGAVDRSRNPNLKRVIVVGVHEGGFPATPNRPGLLTETEHRELDALGARLGTDSRQQLAHERFYGYIAFTRSSSRLVITWSERDSEDRPQLPSPFMAHLNRLFPDWVPEPFVDIRSPINARHRCELWSAALKSLHERVPEAGSLHEWVCPQGSTARRRLEQLAVYDRWPSLSEATAARLYGPVLHSSVSALEKFASCPFRFFVAHGLRAEERKMFVADAREQGSFQHEILARFHEELTAEGRRWRDIKPAEARLRIRQIGQQVTQDYRAGLFRNAPGGTFTARALTTALEDFVEVTVEWMADYAFDPTAVELGFGLGPNALPGWILQLDPTRSLELRGKIDRIDIAPFGPEGRPFGVVLDYKSGPQSLDPVLVNHGVQLQLLAYLAVLRALPAAARRLGHSAIEPAGVFYVGLRGSPPRESHRTAALAQSNDPRRQIYQHRGRYRLDALHWFDAGAPDRPSGQFNHRFTKDGRPTAGSKDALTGPALLGALDSVEDHLRTLGGRILCGHIGIEPYQHGSSKACDRCDYRSVCRVDPWTHEFRALGAEPNRTDHETD